MNFLESYSKQEDKKKALFTKDNILSYVGYVIIGILAGLMMQADGGSPTHVTFTGEKTEDTP